LYLRGRNRLGGRRRLNTEFLHNFCASPNIISVNKSSIMIWAGHAARVGEMRIAYKILVGKPEGKMSLGRYRSKWEINMRMDLREIRWKVCIGFIWLRVGTNRTL